MKQLALGLVCALLLFGAIWAHAIGLGALATAMLFAVTFTVAQYFEQLQVHASYTNNTFVLLVKFNE